VLDPEQVTFLGAEWVPAAPISAPNPTLPDGIPQILGSLQAGEVVEAAFPVRC
jgi:hypothetical protein